MLLVGFRRAEVLRDIVASFARNVTRASIAEAPLELGEAARQKEGLIDPTSRSRPVDPGSGGKQAEQTSDGSTTIATSSSPQKQRPAHDCHDEDHIHILHGCRGVEVGPARRERRHLRHLPRAVRRDLREMQIPRRRLSDQYVTLPTSTSPVNLPPIRCINRSLLC